MIEVSEFKKHWRDDQTKYEVLGMLLKCIEPEGLLLVDPEKLQKDGSEHAILLDDATIIGKILTEVSGNTGGPSFCRKAIVDGQIEELKGKAMFRVKHLFSITILDFPTGPKQFTF